MRKSEISTTCANLSQNGHSFLFLQQVETLITPCGRALLAASLGSLGFRPRAAARPCFAGYAVRAALWREAQGTERIPFAR